jgi:hypothetical protein
MLVSARMDRAAGQSHISSPTHVTFPMSICSFCSRLYLVTWTCEAQQNLRLGITNWLTAAAHNNTASTAVDTYHRRRYEGTNGAVSKLNGRKQFNVFRDRKNVQ